MSALVVFTEAVIAKAGGSWGPARIPAAVLGALGTVSEAPAPHTCVSFPKEQGWSAPGWGPQGHWQACTGPVATPAAQGRPAPGPRVHGTYEDWEQQAGRQC